MKRLIMILLLMGFFLTGCGDGRTYTRAAENGEDVFWGDSIPARCDLYVRGLNRAYPGDTSIQTLELVEYYLDIDPPARHHITVGVNDVYSGIADTYAYRLNAIFAILKGEVIFTSILPTRDPEMNEGIKALNSQARTLAGQWAHTTFRDVYDDFTDTQGLLDTRYALDDGVHLTPAGCEALFSQ